MWLSFAQDICAWGCLQRPAMSLKEKVVSFSFSFPPSRWECRYVACHLDSCRWGQCPRHGRQDRISLGPWWPVDRAAQTLVRQRYTSLLCLFCYFWSLSRTAVFITNTEVSILVYFHRFFTCRIQQAITF